MRKIDRTTSEAFFDRKNLKLSNSEVKTEGDLTVLYLHGNPIITHKDLAGNKFNTCGWDTPTTFARLNGVLSVFKSKAFRKGGKNFILTESGEKLPFNRQFFRSFNGERKTDLQPDFDFNF